MKEVDSNEIAEEGEVSFDAVLHVGQKEDQWYVMVQAAKGLNGKEILDSWIALTQFLLSESKKICDGDNNAERKKTADWLRAIFDKHVEHYLGEPEEVLPEGS